MSGDDDSRTTRRELLRGVGAGATGELALTAGCTAALPPLSQRVRFGRVDEPDAPAPEYRKWLPAPSQLPDDVPNDGYQAFRGLRRNQSRPMRYLSVGLIVLTAVTYTVAFAGTMLFRLRVLELPLQDWFRLVVRLLQLVGLVLIAYSLSVRGE